MKSEEPESLPASEIEQDVDDLAIRRKVVFFTTGMTSGGAERVVATLANALAERNYDVGIVMLKGEESAYELAPRVKLHSAQLLPGINNAFRAIRFYQKIIRREAPDVIASLSVKSDLIALASKILFRTRGRLIVSDRADPYTRARPMQLACNTMYRWADALVCQSHSVADYYRKRLKRANIGVIPNPIDEGAIGVSATGPRVPTVISVGRLSDQKNHRLAISAFKEIRGVFPDLTLKIYGVGPLESQLERLIQHEGMGGSVVLEGVLPNVIRRNANAALFLYTSNYEGYPNALMEAAATGIPSVTTDFSPGTAKEIVDAGVNGYIVPVGDRDAIVKAAIEVLSGALDPRAVAAAATRVRDRHQIEGILDAWLEVFYSP